MQAQARICPICIDDHGDHRECYPADLIERIATLTSKLDELRDLVVWAVENHVSKRHNGLWRDRVSGMHGLGYKIDCDGTPAGIIEALRRAKEGRGDGE